MSYEVELTATARRNLDKLPEAVAAACFEFMAGALAQNPHRVGGRLVGPLALRFSARRGSYRLIYAIDDDLMSVTVEAIEHRADVYRRRG